MHVTFSVLKRCSWSMLPWVRKMTFSSINTFCASQASQYTRTVSVFPLNVFSSLRRSLGSNESNKLANSSKKKIWSKQVKPLQHLPMWRSRSFKNPIKMAWDGAIRCYIALKCYLGRKDYRHSASRKYLVVYCLRGMFVGLGVTGDKR